MKKKKTTHVQKRKNKYSHVEQMEKWTFTIAGQLNGFVFFFSSFLVQFLFFLCLFKRSFMVFSPKYLRLGVPNPHSVSFGIYMWEHKSSSTLIRMSIAFDMPHTTLLTPSVRQISRFLPAIHDANSVIKFCLCWTTCGVNVSLPLSCLPRKFCSLFYFQFMVCMLGRVSTRVPDLHTKLLRSCSTIVIWLYGLGK